jgi:hypothetical protein
MKPLTHHHSPQGSKECNHLFKKIDTLTKLKVVVTVLTSLLSFLLQMSLSTIETSITQAKPLANSTGKMIIVDVALGVSLSTRISVYPDNVKMGDTIECNECETTCVVGENHECLTCDKCGDEMSVSTCLGTAECCFNYENICNNCAIWDNDKDKVICEDCQHDTEPKMTQNEYLWSKDARNPHDGTPMPVNYPHM